MTSTHHTCPAALGFGKLTVAVKEGAHEARISRGSVFHKAKAVPSDFRFVGLSNRISTNSGFFTSIAAVCRTIDMPMSGADDREPDALIKRRRCRLAGGTTENVQKAIGVSVRFTIRTHDNENQTFGGCSSSNGVTYG